MQLQQYKGVETSPQPSAFARFKKNSADKRGSRTGKTFAAKKSACLLIDNVGHCCGLTNNFHP